MRERRDAKRATRRYEDGGPINAPLQELLIVLYPDLRRNSHGDLVVGGYIINDQMKEKSIEVQFSGHRTATAGPLSDRLRRMQEAAFDDPRDKGSDPPPLWNIRLPIVARGIWRKRPTEDAARWQNRHLTFVASQWSVPDDTGRFLTHGQDPASDDGFF